MSSDPNTPIDPKTQFQYEQYRSVLSGDPIATTLRFHLLTENLLEQLIKLALPRGDKIVESGNYSYAQKLGIVDAAQIVDDRFLSALRNLNRLRNRCSHEISHQVTHADVQSVGSPLGKEWTKIKNDHHDAPSQFNFVAGYLSVALNVAIERLERSQLLVPASGDVPKR